MRHHEQVRVIRELHRHLDDDTNVDAGQLAYNPIESYIDPEIAAEEWNTLFRQRPHVIGLSGDLPHIGSFMTHNDLGFPLLCTRDDSGRFRVFLNVCRHRGTQLTTEARGSTRRFSCPFHAWSYTVGGELSSIPKPHHFGDIDHRCHDLVELPSCERHGLLIAHPDSSGTIGDDLFAALDDELASWGLGRADHVTTITYSHDMNWKFAVDTYGETYHFNVLHRSTLAGDYYGNVQTYETYGPHHRMVLCLKAVDQLRDQPEAEWNVLVAGTPVYFLFPNTQLIMNTGGPVLAQIYPNESDPHHSHTRLSFYTNPDLGDIVLDDDAKAHFANLERRMSRFAEVIRDEDYAAAASNHIGALSNAQRYLTFGRNEPALHHYHNEFRRALGSQPLTVAGSDGEAAGIDAPLTGTR